MKTVEEYIVPWVRSSEPYGESHVDFAWANPDVARMMSNENPMPPSDKVLSAIVEAAKHGNLYPESGARLQARLGEDAGLGPENVVLGDGSTDVISFVVGTFVAPGEEVVIPVPTFSMYESRTRIVGGTPVLVPMTSDFRWDIDAILRAVTEKTKVVFIASPNNPTGNQIPEGDLMRIVELGLPIFLDEAYYELENEPRTRAYLVREHPHVMISRTFSKAYGLAGLRLGYVLCDATLADYFTRVRNPWNVSLLALAAALACLEDEEDHREKRQNILAGRQYILDQANGIPGIRAYPSEGNFLLVDASCLGLSSSEIVKGMIERGVFIRAMDAHNATRGFVRVTVGTPDMNRKFVEAFRAFVEEMGGGRVVAQSE
jgi:histidinol-phosphate aminotransferase